MKKSLLLVLIAMMSLVPPSFADTLKGSIVVVDPIRAIMSTHASVKLVKEFKKKNQKQIEQLSKIEQLLKEWQAKLPRLPDPEREASQISFNDERNTFLFQAEQFERLKQTEQTKIIESQRQLYEDVMTKIMEEKKQQIVLDKRAVIWADSKEDITDEVTKRMNTEAAKQKTDEPQ